MNENSILNKGVNALTSLTSLSGLFWENQNDNKGSLVSDERMIALGDALQGVLKESKIEIPKIVAVGTQSSGKSSVLNSLIGMDILPTGKQMVTRTPLHLEIVHSTNKENKSYAEFGEYSNGSWDVSNTFQITFPKPTEHERNLISEYIEKETCNKAGSQRDVSSNIINLRIVSPYVSNLSFIDLPGLTAVACTDQGQPKDIKDKIERLVGQFIEKDSTLILAVMQGRADLEADMGLELVKKYDPTGERTLGVITKLDLMNEPSDIVRYLENKVSKDLQLKHGYFAVKNRNSIEKKTNSVEEGLQTEVDYFSKNPIFTKDSIKHCIGIPCLKKYLAHLLTNAMKMSLPVIQTEITKELGEVQKLLNQLGSELPETSEKKQSYLHNILMEFSKNFSQCILARGSSASTGRNIRGHLVDCRENIDKNNVFLIQNKVKDEHLLDIVRNSEGNHMSFPYPPVEILERCLQNSKIRPIYELINPIVECNADITKELVKLVDELVENSEISRFPELEKSVRHETIQNIIVPCSSVCNNKLLEMIQMQENYIWTDDPDFREALMAFGKEEYTDDIIPSLRNLLSKYIISISKHLQDVIPKSIMFYCVKDCIDKMNINIYTKISGKDINELLVEDTAVDRKRQEYSNLKRELDTANNTILKLL